MTPVTRGQKELAAYTASAFGVERPPIVRYWDDDRNSDVYILKAANSPQNGVTSFATIGLSNHPLVLNGEEFGLRVEIVAACGSNYLGFENVLATLAFCVINSGWFCAPGIIFPGVLSMYGLSTTLVDVYFTKPFIWGEALASTSFGELKVAWLLAVPISKEETEFARINGPERLEALFAEKSIDIYDLNRPSVA